MPACGTVTTSPGWRTMLLDVSPVSRIWLRFTVMVLVSGGGTGSATAELGESLLVDGGVCAASGAWAGEFGALSATGGIATGEGSCGTSLLGEGSADSTSAASIVGGSEASAVGSVSARVTMTWSPASLEIPPASARSSMRVI